MKITKSELKEIIKEEASRFISIQKLKKEKEKINLELKKIMENQEMEEGVIDTIKKTGAKILTPKSVQEKGKKAFDERFEKLKNELKSKGYDDDKVISVDKWGKKVEGLDEKTLRDSAEQNAYKGRLVYKYAPSLKKVVVNFSPGSLTHADTSATGLDESLNINESDIRRIFKEEAIKTEKLKQLQEKAEKLSKELRNL